MVHAFADRRLEQKSLRYLDAVTIPYEAHLSTPQQPWQITHHFQSGVSADSLKQHSTL